MNMLRVLVGLLVLANALFLVWTQGWLDAFVGVRAAGDREPQRLAQQVRPDVVRIITPEALAAEVLAAAEATAAQTQTAAGTPCLEAGPFNARTVGPAEAALVATLPTGTWSRVVIDRDGAVVYMLRVQSTDPALMARVAGLHLDALGKGFAACSRP
jgi:hypothetical protein